MRLLPLFLLAFLLMATPAQATHRDHLLPPIGACENGTSDVSVQLRCYHNAVRLNYGRPTSAFDGRLNMTAADKTGLIVFCKDFRHEACGWPWNHSILKASPVAPYSENIAWVSQHYPLVAFAGLWARATQSEWLHSDSHFNTLMSTNSRWAGCHARLSADWPDPGANVVSACHFAYSFN